MLILNPKTEKATTENLGSERIRKRINSIKIG